MKKITVLLVIAGVMVLLLASCQKESNRTNVQLNIRSSETLIKSASSDIQTVIKSSSAALSAIVIEEFLINIREVEFELDESFSGFDGSYESSDDDNDEFDDDDIYDDIEFEGPYLIDIMSQDVLDGMVLDNFSLPYATFDEIELDIAPSHDLDNAKMAGHSIFVAGTIDGMPFELWTNKEEEIEIEFDDDQAVSLTQEDIKFYINISLDKIKSNLGAMNLGAAADGNNNGIIEIGHDDPDGNHELASSLLNAFAGCFDLDDQADDHDDDDDDDDDH